MCTKRLENTCAKFGETGWPVSNIWTSRQIDTTLTKVCISDPNPNANVTRAVHQNVPKWRKIIYTSQFMFNSGDVLRIILFLFDPNIKCLWRCVQSFGQICRLVSDLWTSRQISTTRTKVYINDPGLIRLKP